MPARAAHVPMADMDGQQRALVDAFHILARHDLGARVAGHITLRVGDGFLTHRFGLGFEEITEADLVACHFDLGPRGPAAPVNPTMHIHAQIYLARPDVMAIAHTHGPAVVALSATGADFVACSQMAGIFHDDIGSFDEREMIVLTPQDGAQMARALGSRSAMILKNHGSLVVAGSLQELVLRTVVLEEAADIQLRAMAAGGAHGLGAAAAAQVKRFVLSPALMQHYWDYEIRRLGRTHQQTGEPAHDRVR